MSQNLICMNYIHVHWQQKGRSEIYLWLFFYIYEIRDEKYGNKYICTRNSFKGINHHLNFCMHLNFS